MDEAEYVLAVLQRMRDTVSANPELFDPTAQARIDEAIICIQNVIRSTPSELAAAVPWPSTSSPRPGSSTFTKSLMAWTEMRWRIRQRLSGTTVEKRLEELGVSVELQTHSRPNGAYQSRVAPLMQWAHRLKDLVKTRRYSQAAGVGLLLGILLPPARQCCNQLFQTGHFTQNHGSTLAERVAKPRANRA